MYIACKTNSYCFVKYLIVTLTSDPNYIFSEGVPIEVTNDSKIMQLLIQHGARVQPGHIEKLFIVSTEEKPIYPDTFKHLRETGQWYPDLVCNSLGDTALHLSGRYQMYEIAHYLLSKAKCDPYFKNLHRETPVQLLMCVYKWSSNEIINITKALMNAKQWYPNSRYNTKGDTALHLSAKYYRYEVVKFLLSCTNCDPNITNQRKETLMQILLSEHKW